MCRYSISAYFEDSGCRRGYTVDGDADLLIRKKYEEEEERMEVEREYCRQKKEIVEKRRLMAKTLNAFKGM